MSIILPLGISFHTFQSMSYVIDVYRREQEPIRNPIDYALFISFFPQLVAGPIVRARDFFPDLHAWKRPSSDDAARGILLLLLGLVKKTVMADQSPRSRTRISETRPCIRGCWRRGPERLRFGIQIYFDFSGYTDMAIGMAKLLGFHFPVNFPPPVSGVEHHGFLASLAHLALALAARLSLHPFGGNRHGQLNTYRNLMITMLLGGLWHGASWNFVAWGGYHGALLSVERMFRGTEPGSNRWTFLYPVKAAATFALVMFGWVFFRAGTFHDSVYVLGQMFAGKAGLTGGLPISPWLIYLALITLVLALLEERLGWFERIAVGPAWAYGAVCAVLMLAVGVTGLQRASGALCVLPVLENGD